MRKFASSIAVSPPPMINTSCSRKKKPSQVAHAETPKPMNWPSDGMPSSLADAPVAMMSASVCSVLLSSIVTSNGERDRSTFVTVPSMNSVPKRAAWPSISSMSAGPMIPCLKPG